MQQHTHRSTALVVENDILQRALVSMLLEEHDMTVIQCESAEAAVLVLENSGQDVTLVYTDVELAGIMDGIDGRVARLTVWGGVFATAPDFEAEANARIAGDTEDGWGLAAHATSPTWATWSATKPGRVMHQHMIALCDGQGYAALRFDYAQVDRRRLDTMIEPLIASFKAPC